MRKMTLDRPVDQLSTTKETERKIVFDLNEKRFKVETVEKTRRPVVAFDVDGVIANFDSSMYPFSNKTGESSPADYNYVESGWFDSWDDFEKAHVTVMEKASEIPLLDDTASTAMKLLQNNNMDIIVVTARREQWREETLRFLHKHGMDISNEKLHIMDKKDKTSIHFDYLIDDAPKNIIDVLKNAPSSTPVIYNRRYNEHLPGDRVHSLEQFAEFILEKENTK